MRRFAIWLRRLLIAVLGKRLIEANLEARWQQALLDFEKAGRRLV